MPIERDGRRTNARASAPTFPPDDAREERPSHADSSHIARRRVSSAPAHEVGLDEIELIDDAPAPAVPPPLPSPSEAAPPNAPFQVPITAGVFRARRAIGRSTVVVLGVVLAAAIGASAAVITRAPVPHAVVEISDAKVPARSAALPATTSEVPVVDVANLPRASFGTVIGVAGHRLWIDGALAASSQASVSCGKHVVQVGSAGVPRTIDVPCGEGVIAVP